MKLNLFGKPETTQVEDRLFNTATFFASITVYIGFILGLLFNYPLWFNLIILSVGCICSLFYYLGRFKRTNKFLKTPLLFVIIFVISLSWFYNEGLEGSTSFYFFVAIICFLFMFKEIQYYFIMFSFVLLGLILIFIQYYFPEMIAPYSSPEFQFFDLSIIFITTLIITGVAVISFKKNFDRERKRIEIQNEKYKQINEELIRAKEKAEESDQLKSAFLANMSHEIRTPMNSILGFSSLLKRENLSKEKKEKYLELIDSGGNRLLNLISDIVDVSKIDVNQLSINYEACNVNELLDNLQEQFKIQNANKECDIIINKGLDDVKSIISTDKTRLSQILSNLLENALKFTEKGDIEFGYFKKDKMLEFFVKDTGIGIDPKYHKTIFERFKQVDNDYSRSGSGTGLGLSIVRSLSELLGGKVWVESEKDKGAAFYFTLPYNIAESNKDKTPETNLNLDQDKEITILIAEDEYSNYVYLEALFEDFQYNIIHAKNGKEAIEMVENNDTIDLILMDIKMPVLNGLEATKEIRKTNKLIPIISLTAYAMAEDKQKALKAGCDDYIAKPLSEKKLTEMMKKHLKKGANKRYMS